MAHFYGVLSGGRGQATRCGTKGSGLATTAASWGGAVRVSLWHDEQTGEDRYTVEEIPWHGHGRNKRIAEGAIGR